MCTFSLLSLFATHNFYRACTAGFPTSCSRLYVPEPTCSCFSTAVNGEAAPATTSSCAQRVWAGCGLCACVVLVSWAGMGLMPIAMDRDIRFTRPCLWRSHFGRLSIATRFEFRDSVFTVHYSVTPSCNPDAPPRLRHLSAGGCSWSRQKSPHLLIPPPPVHVCVSTPPGTCRMLRFFCNPSMLRRRPSATHHRRQSWLRHGHVDKHVPPHPMVHRTLLK